MAEIIELLAHEILDSRGNPTLSVECWTDEGGYGHARVPSGASTGSREAKELRDNDADRYNGKGVLKAVENVNNEIAEQIIGWDVTDQVGIDLMLKELDGTENKSRLGANAIIGVSMAVAKAAADELDLPLSQYLGGVNARVLPVPFCNVINGGAHASNIIDFQEFLIVPVGAQSFHEALEMAADVFHALKKILNHAGHITTVGDEGGFAPNLSTPEEALDFIIEAIKTAGYEAGPQGIMLAMDVAASELYNPESKCYEYVGETKALGHDKLIVRTTDEQVAYLESLVKKYPLISIEDGLAEDDWAGFEKLVKILKSHHVQVVGDDLFVTNTIYVNKGIQVKAANAVLIKVNQIGTVTETIETINLAHRAGWATQVSHRSGETVDTFIADLAVAFNTGQIKTGSLSRSERMVKYNQLLKIEQELGPQAIYLGINAIRA